MSVTLIMVPRQPKKSSPCVTEPNLLQDGSDVTGERSTERWRLMVFNSISRVN